MSLLILLAIIGLWQITIAAHNEQVQDKHDKSYEAFQAENDKDFYNLD